MPLKFMFSRMQFFYIQMVLFCWNFPALANEVSGQSQPTPPQPTILERLFPFILLGLFFYFVLIRPQQKRHRRHEDFLSKIKRGEEVLTNSGIYGKIEGITEQFVILEVADEVRIRIVKSQIASYAGTHKSS